jgi:hypothetical protein
MFLRCSSSSRGRGVRSDWIACAVQDDLRLAQELLPLLAADLERAPQAHLVHGRNVLVVAQLGATLDLVHGPADEDGVPLPARPQAQVLEGLLAAARRHALRRGELDGPSARADREVAERLRHRVGERDEFAREPRAEGIGIRLAADGRRITGR